MENGSAGTKCQMKYDLDLNGNTCIGELVLCNGTLEAIENEEVVYSIAIDSIKDMKLTLNIGCAFLECKHNDKDRLLCRFTMGVLKEAGEFCKVINYCIETGYIEEKLDVESRECPKCNRILMDGTDVCFFCVDKLHVFKKALKLFEPFKKSFIIAGTLLALSNVLYVIAPVINRILIDDYLKPKRGTAFDIIFWCVIMFLLRAGGEIIFIVSSRISNRVSGKFANNLRKMTYEKMQSLSMTSMSKKTSGDLLKRITKDTQKIKNFLTDQGRWVLEQSLVFILVAIILFTSNPILALMVFVPVPLVMILIYKVRRNIFSRYEKQWRLESRSNSILHDIIKGIRVVKTFGNEKREIDKFNKSCKDIADVASKNEKLFALFFPPLGFLVGVGEFLVLYFGGKKIIGRELTMGELVQFTLYLSYVYGPLRWMTNIPRWLADVAASLVKLFEILDEVPDMQDSKDKIETDINGAIEFKNVVFGYKSYEPVLKDITLKIKPGEMVGIVGHSGVGKSTFINLVMRLYDINGGRILIDGNDIRNISKKTLHESIGVVFQDTFLFAGSIFDNIAYARSDATQEDVIAASKIANAHEFIIKLPDAYNTEIGENGYSLSGGERQRVAIARAVLRNPSILILDEATASLDVETESKIQEALLRLTKGRTTIAIAHRLSTLRHADRLIVLDKGKLAEIGTHDELLKMKGIYYKLVMAQRQTSKIQSA